MTLDTKGKFTEIYLHNLWNNEESRSGIGSTIGRTTKIRKGIQDLFVTEGIRSICDAGCGDFNWMKQVDFVRVRYIGVDIVRDLIRANKKEYERENVSFLELDIIKDKLPAVDLIICREVLLHFSFHDLCATLHNFKNTGARFLLTTHYPSITGNVDIRTGKCHVINLRLAPLNFPEPLKTIEEDVSDQCLALWKLEDIEPGKF
jgi:SAM-dependent methyltransferase